MAEATEFRFSVVIPALNESARIASVVEFAKASPRVAEVVVVDDGSIDDTAGLARDAGARVITSTFLGKGGSMGDGLFAAREEHVLFLDGDLAGLAPDLIERMAAPFIAGRSDLVKARFSREAGRVTTLTARPLLRTFFPELIRFDQPLGGIVAARRQLLRSLRLEPDYGVDVGLLIDAALAGARIVEVDIGAIEHVSHALEVLGDMATQVVRTILERAARYGRLSLDQVKEVEEVERRAQAELSVVLQRVGQARRLALFDMDGVLVDGRFVTALAQRTNKNQELAEFLDRRDVPAAQRSSRIARLFKGVPTAEFERTARALPLMEGAVDTVVQLRRRGYTVGIVTDSYRVAAEIVRRRVFADFCVANVMRFRKGVAAGELQEAPFFAHAAGCPEHPHCKRNVLHHMLERMGLPAGEVLAVGNGENDVCMLKAAGCSIAFEPATPLVAAAAQHSVEGSLSAILPLVPK